MMVMRDMSGRSARRRGSQKPGTPAASPPPTCAAAKSGTIAAKAKAASSARRKRRGATVVNRNRPCDVIISKWLTRALPERWAAFIDEKARVASREGASKPTRPLFPKERAGRLSGGRPGFRAGACGEFWRHRILGPCGGEFFEQRGRPMAVGCAQVKCFQVARAPVRRGVGRPRLEHGERLLLTAAHHDGAERAQQRGIAAGGRRRADTDRRAKLLVGGFQTRRGVDGVAMRRVVELGADADVTDNGGAGLEAAAG